MPRLTYQRCFNHSAREAVARCPECARFYCRECVTEHDDRVICAACVRKLAAGPAQKRGAFAGLLRGAQVALGFTIVWLCFHMLGRSLVAIPAKFHDGTVWKQSWLDQR